MNMRRFTLAARSGLAQAHGLVKEDNEQSSGLARLREGINNRGGHLATLFLFCCGLMCISSFLISLHAETKASNKSYIGQVKQSTLVMYIYSASDPMSTSNLQHFVKYGMQAHSKRQLEFVVLVNLFGGVDRTKLPTLPSHAKYVFHGSSCNHHGSIGWYLLHSGEVDLDKFYFYVFIDSSMRGPFVPQYMDSDWHWVEAFTDKLTSTTKLVGPVISCAGVAHRGQPDGAWRRVPHVETSAMATDREGLQVLIDNGQALACHNVLWELQWYSEAGTSLALLQEGYNLDCLLLRYQGIDWRKRAGWRCNGDTPPGDLEGAYDGLSINPLEALFVRHTTVAVELQTQHVEEALKYDNWLHNETLLRLPPGAQEIVGSAYADEALKHKLPTMLAMTTTGKSCFGTHYYLDHNPDLAAQTHDPHVLWKHFLLKGVFQDRPFKFVCNEASRVYQQMVDAHDSGEDLIVAMAANSVV